MKKYLNPLKIMAEIGGFLLLFLVLIVAISFLRGNGQGGVISAETGIYPPPQDGTLQAYPSPEEQPTSTAISQQESFIGPGCFIDHSKNVSMMLPQGWHGDINSNSIDITNYHPDSIQYIHGKPMNLPANQIKIEIYILELDPNQSLEQYISTQKTQVENQDNTRSNLTFSENSPYNIGEYEGLAYAITDSTGWNSRAIIVQVSDNKAISISIFPADSQAFTDALAILATLNTSENPTCSENSSALPQKAADFPEKLNQIKGVTTDFECPQGVTYSGTEAKSSIIELQMPFPWGQTWIVGGGGSFYGNYHHCNYYNNYYATDWNKPDNDDEDAFVVSVAEGVVTYVISPPNCGLGGAYGCYVDVDHASDFRTRYAHLGSVLVSTGVSVETGTILGRVGNTGTNNFHLHLSFWHLDFVDSHYMYLSQC